MLHLFSGVTTTASFFYDEAIDDWIPGPDLPVALSDHCILELSPSKIMLIGGSSKTGSGSPVLLQSDTYTYDFNDTSPVWANAGPMSQAKSHHACDVIAWSDGTMRPIVAGGIRILPSVKTPRIEAYDWALGAWENLGVGLQVPGYYIGTAVIGTDLFLLGGRTGGANVENDLIYRFSSVTLTITQLPHVIAGAYQADAFVFNCPN